MFVPSSRRDSLWLSEPPLAIGPFSGEIESDVLVIGGGITGLTLALTLREQGADVTLFEAGGLAGAASGRNAGFLLAAPAEPYSEQVAFWGRAGARAVLETGRRAHQRLHQLIESHGIACDYRAGGSLRLTRDAEEADEHRDSIGLMRADGFTMHEVAVADAVPGPLAEHFTAAFVMPEDGEVHPVRMLYGFANAAIASGARLHTDSPVLGARYDGGVWELQTAHGKARGRTLVLATNAWAPELCPALGTLIEPRRGQMLATAPLARDVASMPTYAHYGYQYWRQTPDRRLVIGGWRDLAADTEVGFGIDPGDDIQAAIERGLAELVPEGAAIEYRWAGTMGFARDGRPLVGWLDAKHHLAICAGFTGHGMGMAAACTQDLAELLQWRDAPGIATYDPGRFSELGHAHESVTTLGVRR